MSISVVVVSYKPGDWLQPCLRSVRDQADEVILIDNGSAGMRATELGEDLATRVLRSPKNLGFSPAVNEGVRSANGDIIAVLNDDAVAADTWLSSSADRLKDGSIAAVMPKVLLAGWYREVILADTPWSPEGDPRVLGRQLRSVTSGGTERLEEIVGVGVHRVETDKDGLFRWTGGAAPWYVPVPTSETPVPIYVNGELAPPGATCRLINSTGCYLRTDGYAGDRGLEAPDDGRFDTAWEPFAVSGAAFAFTADTWNRLGGLAERYFAYYEDLDWSWRARLAGMRLAYDPASVVHHHRSATSGGGSDPKVRRLAERNRTLTMIRNGPLDQVRSAILSRITYGADGGVRSDVLSALPWAFRSRLALKELWVQDPAEVWSAWAGTTTVWPDGPYRCP